MSEEEVACLVLNYLQITKFPRTFEVFKEESKHLTSQFQELTRGEVFHYHLFSISYKL